MKTSPPVSVDALKKLTDEQLIKLHLGVKAKITAINKQTEETARPWKGAKTNIENIMLGRLIDRGLQNAAVAGVGTAARHTLITYSVEDPSKLRSAIEDDPLLLDVLKMSVEPDSVRDYVEEHDALPPGVKRTEFTQCRITKRK